MTEDAALGSTEDRLDIWDLEVQFRAELEAPVSARGSGISYCQRTGDPAEVSISEGCIRIRELRRIRNAVSFGTKLEIKALGEPETTEESRVQVEESWAVRCKASDIPELASNRCRKIGRVEPRGAIDTMEDPDGAVDVWRVVTCTGGVQGSRTRHEIHRRTTH